MRVEIQHVDAITEEMLCAALAEIENEYTKRYTRFLEVANRIGLDHDAIEAYKATGSECAPSYHQLALPWADCKKLHPSLSNAREKVAKSRLYARKESYAVRVYDAFTIKDSLKASGYRFDGNDKAWVKKVDTASEAEAAKAEIAK